ncbi:hypothetical protein SDC9_202619 [bioreactor metagenome]|uniref:Uncharacterized protein n=1 Tax=bioreactor metagenome TaxID=1076179 RepID=A0A645IVM8_9ZZZZ
MGLQLHFQFFGYPAPLVGQNKDCFPAVERIVFSQDQAFFFQNIGGISKGTVPQTNRFAVIIHGFALVFKNKHESARFG